MNRNPDVLVTGSSGLIGAAVCKALAKDYQVVGFDRDGHPYPPPEAECDDGRVAVGTPATPGGAPASYTFRNAAKDPFNVDHKFCMGKVAEDGTPKVSEDLAK